MTWPQATRGLRDADAQELAAMRDAAAVPLAHQRRISPRVLTDLCLIRVESTAEMRKRVHAASVTSDSRA